MGPTVGPRSLVLSGLNLLGRLLVHWQVSGAHSGVGDEVRRGGSSPGLGRSRARRIPAMFVVERAWNMVKRVEVGQCEGRVKWVQCYQEEGQLKTHHCEGFGR